MPVAYNITPREIVASLICSRLYFELSLRERLALVRELCGEGQS